MQQSEAKAIRPAPASWDLDSQTTLIRILADNARKFPSGIAMREKDLGIWQEWTWTEVLDLVLAGAAGLERLGFAEGDVMMILGDNRVHLYLGMLSVGALRGAPMPVYPDATPDEIQHFARQANARFALTEDQEQMDKVLDLREQVETIEHVMYDDPRGLGHYAAPGLISWDEVIAMGAKRLEEESDLRDALVGRAKPDDPAVFVHSSGTTGLPKGIVVTHRRMLAAVRNSYLGGAFNEGEEILAYLPMAWIGDFCVSMGAGISLHFAINVPERQETVLQNLREIAPTLYFSAPRSWDNILTTIQVRMEDSTPLKKRTFDYFLKLALASERAKMAGEEPTVWQRLMKPVGEFLVFGPIKDQFGMTRMRNAFTGGEAMGEDTFLFYRALGVDLRQLYGQTETSAYTAMQEVGEVRLHTVGKPLPGTEIRISEDGEILVRSEGVMDGYFKNDDATRNAIVDGWLHTGDAGYLEEDGHLVVLGRVSEVVHTADGERYIPNYIENRLKFSHYIKDVAVLGKDRKFLSAIVCIDIEAVGHWAEINGISYMSYADLSQKPEVSTLVRSAIAHVNDALPDALKITRFVNLHKEFDPDDGEITRTRKLRRKVVEERYAPIIDAIYDGKGSVVMKAQITYETGETGSIERELLVQEV